MHAAHRRAAPHPRIRRHRRHRRLPAAGDPRVLRRRRRARRADAVLGRGVAAGHGGQRARGGGAAGRHVPGDLRRRALRLRSDRAGRAPPGAGRRRDHRPQARRQPARVRRRHHRRGGADRAVPGEAVLGPGLLRHDQHRRLRARALGAARDPRGRAVRLLEAALPRPPGARQAAVRLDRRGLLAGRRDAGAVPAGQRRRARRQGRARHPGHPAARERLSGRRRAAAGARADRGPGLHRQLLADRRRRADRVVLRAWQQRGRQGRRHDPPVGDRLGRLHRPRRTDRGRRPGQAGGRPRARPDQPWRRRSATSARSARRRCSSAGCASTRSRPSSPARSSTPT